MAYALRSSIKLGREQFCDHCERRLRTKLTMISKDAGGGILLNMIVCDPRKQKHKNLDEKPASLT